MTQTTDRPAPQEVHEVDLAITGMTCASCSARIEKKLNKMPGVTATVNYATEKAKVSFAADVDPADLVATVEATGYTATLPAPPTTDTTSAPVDAAQRAKETLRDHVAQLAVAGASQILRREINQQVHAELLANLKRELA